MYLIRAQGIEMLLYVAIVVELAGVSSSFNIYEPARIPGWNHFGYTWMEPKPSLVFRKPMSAMVDLTNDLGVAILQDYSYSRSNFAFSPYGVASVLVVLYEGARGESARQIHRAVKFPWDRDITRVGFRDIHRHLRSYFSHEGYLSGITLSKEGSTLRPEYKRILRFYGYDVDIDSVEKATDSPPSSTTEKIPSSSTPTTSKEITTVRGHDVTITKEIDGEDTNIATTAINSGGSSTSISDETTETLTTRESTDTATVVGTDAGTPEATDPSEATNLETTTDAFTETPTSPLEYPTEEVTPTEFTTEDGLRGTDPSSEEPGTSADAEELLSTTPMVITEELAAIKQPETTENVTENKVDRKRNTQSLDNGMLIPQVIGDGRRSPFHSESDLDYKAKEKKNAIDDAREVFTGGWKEMKGSLVAEGDRIEWEPKTLDEFLLDLVRSANATKMVGRRKRLAPGRHYLVGFRVPNEKKPSAIKTRAMDFETSARLKRGHSTKEKRTISEFLKIPAVTDLSLQLQNGMFDSHVSKNTDLYRALPKFLFLVDGAIDTPVPMMTYSNIFPFAYIPRLHCKALEFPLDDERYKLLILLPVERRGLRQLIYDLGSFPLGEVIDVLRPARVKAMVPTFMVEGFVILTPTLQKLGIWDVFDPRRSDLSGMTTDPDLYVRNIEQSVTVVIRNYVEILDIQTRTMAARDIDEEFTASHPFLYFVMDTTTNVALMAGQMLDPLNSRIY